MQEKERNTVVDKEQEEGLYMEATECEETVLAEETTGDEEAVLTEDSERKRLWQDNRGVGVVEIILILVVLIALVVIFKDQLTSMVTKAMEALEKSMSEVLS